MASVICCFSDLPRRQRCIRGQFGCLGQGSLWGCGCFHSQLWEPHRDIARSAKPNVAPQRSSAPYLPDALQGCPWRPGSTG